MAEYYYYYMDYFLFLIEDYFMYFMQEYYPVEGMEEGEETPEQVVPGTTVVSGSDTAMDIDEEEAEEDPDNFDHEETAMDLSSFCQNDC